MTALLTASSPSRTVAPLRARRLDGRPYLRKPDIEEQIASCLAMPLADVVSLGTITDARDPAFIQSEVLLHLLRKARRENDRRALAKLYPLVLDRARRFVMRFITNVPGRHSDSFRQHTLDRFIEFVAAEERSQRALDAFEVHFNLSLKYIALESLRRLPRRMRIRRHLDINDPAQCQLPAPPHRVDEHWDLARAIAALPERQARVIHAYLQGYNLRPNHEGPDKTVAAAVGSTTWAVDTQWKAAIKALRGIMARPLEVASPRLSA